MFRFADPLYFLLLIPLAIGTWLVYRRRRRAGLLFSATAQLPATPRTARLAAAQVMPFLVLLGLAAAIVALARPQTILSQSKRTANVVAIQMVVDTSGSMEALDMSDFNSRGEIARPVTRLEAVKTAFSEFVARRPDDLIGLISFAGYVATRAPLTTDQAALKHVLQGVEIPRAVQDAGGRIINQEEMLTAIGDALATACARLRDVEVKSKIIVLLSDGVSNAGIITPEQATKIASELGIRVYAIGVGIDGRAPFKFRDPFGRDVVQVVEVPMDEAALKTIANQTGGRYFGVRDRDGLEEAMTAINALEKTRVERDVYHLYDEWADALLLPALLLILAGIGFNMLITRTIV